MNPRDETVQRERLFHSSNQTCKDDVALLETVYKNTETGLTETTGVKMSWCMCQNCFD
jgi:hypothetical protein